MRSLLPIAFLFFLAPLTSLSQTGYNFSCRKDTVVTGCENSCITLQARIPNLFGQATSFSVVPGNTPAGNCYQIPNPAALPNATGTSGNLTIDDRYSNAVNIPFPFQFFGSTYNQLVMSTNGLISFDVSLANTFSHYSILNNGGTLSALTGTPEDLPSTLYDRALIMGAYQDLDPAYTTSPTQLIQYTTVGTAPYRKFILSFYKVPQFDCSSLIDNTQQIILNESTGIIEVLIYSRQSCSTWNQGRAMIGIQDFSRTQSAMVPGRKASDPVWTVTSNNNNTIPMEAYSFIPSGGASAVSLFKRAELYSMAGTLISTATTTGTGATLQASFPNVCSPSGTTSFVVKSVYRKNDDPNVEVFGYDTVRVIKNNATLSATTSTQPTSCTASTGSITTNVTTGTAPYQYAINGGAMQNSNVFNNLAQGFYIVTVKDAFGCTYNFNASVGLNNTANVNVLPSDTSICVGASFIPRVTSNGASYSWTPTVGVNTITALQPTITAGNAGTTTSYIVTAVLGQCTATDTVKVSVFQTTGANAGPDITIINGDVVQLQAVGASNNTYLWTPATGLSATNILRPMASPTQTTTYTLNQTTPQGCTSSDNVTVTVLNCINPMNAFSPNGDGINDFWLVTQSQCLKSAKVQVYNRYGGVVYESDNYSNDWNGTYKGKPVPDGTYYFVVSYVLANGKPQQLKGNVTILR